MATLACMSANRAQLSDVAQDLATADALAKLKRMQNDLAELKTYRARLEARVITARQEEESVKQELRQAIREVKIEREDLEPAFYSDEGWLEIEQGFRQAWSKRDLAETSSDYLDLGIQGQGLLRKPLSLGPFFSRPRQSQPWTRNAQLLCKAPLVIYFPEFVSTQDCYSLIDLGFRVCRPHQQWAQEMQRPGGLGPLRGVATASLSRRKFSESEVPEDDRLLVRKLQERVADVTGIPIHDHEMNPFLKFDQPGAQHDEMSQAKALLHDLKPSLTPAPPRAAKDDPNIGLHLDINGGFPHCVCSVIMYLNAVERGGRTLFPCVNDEISQASGVELADAGYTHTSSTELAGAQKDAAGNLLERAKVAEGTLRISPQPGAAVLFFTLLGEVANEFADAPRPDPFAWHGGAALEGSIGKWTLQIFKEVPLEHRGGAQEASYVASLRQRLEGSVIETASWLSEMD